MPFIGEDDWFETFEDARGGRGVLHAEATGSGLAVVTYPAGGESSVELVLSDADAHKLADLISRKCS